MFRNLQHAPHCLLARWLAYSVAIWVLSGCTEDVYAPVAVISGPSIATVGEVVALDGSESRDPTGGAVTFAWGFQRLPAGSLASFNSPTAESPSFVPDVAGAYTVSLVVENGPRASEPALFDIEVGTCGGQAPVVESIETDLPTPRAGQVVALSAVVSDADNSELCNLGQTFAYEWQIVGRPSGSQALLEGELGPAPLLPTDLPGSYVVELVVTDDTGRSSAPERIEIVVSDCGTNPPVATLTALPAEPIVGQRVVLSAEVVDADQWDGTADDTCRLAESFTYEWQILSAPAGSVATVATPNAQRSSFVPDLPGNYVIECRVFDEAGHRNVVQDGVGDLTVTVEVSADSSPYVMACNADPDYGVAPMQVFFECDYDGGEEPFSWLWSFGNGVTSTEWFPVYTYTVAGEYVATFIVTDGNGDIGFGTVWVHVLEDTAPQVALAANPTVGQAPLEVALDAAWANGNPPLSFHFSFGDGTTATGRSELTPGGETHGHTYDAAGTYLAVLTVTDDDGDVGMATTQVIATTETDPPNRRPVAVASKDMCAVTGSLVALDGTGSSDPDDTTPPLWDSLTFEWSFLSKPPGSEATLNDGGVVNPSFLPDVDGEYLLRLVVSDGLDSSSDTVLVEASSEIVLLTQGESERYGNAGDPSPLADPFEVLAMNRCQTVDPIVVPGLTIEWQADNASVESLGTRTATSETDGDGVATITGFFGESAKWGAVHARPAALGEETFGPCAEPPCWDVGFRLNVLCDADSACEGGYCDLAADTPTCIGPWHVDDDAVGLGTGATWTDALTHLQRALDVAEAGQSIWVADGTYRPTAETTPGDARTATFLLDRPLSLYGGFDGDELFLNDRPDPLAETVLSGELGEDTRSLHVIAVTGDDVVIEGFAIRDGLAFDPDGVELEAGGGLLAIAVSGLNVRDSAFEQCAAESGGGLYGRELAESVIERCVFRQNSASYGGGIMLENCAATVEVLDTDFFDNQGQINGGGLYLDDSDVIVDGSRFERNDASDQSGGAVTINGDGSTPRLTNCLFIDNSAYWHAGGLAVYGNGNSPLITHSIFYKNRFTSTPSLYHVHAYGDNTPLFVNDIFDAGVVYAPAGSIHYSVVSSWSAEEAEPCVDDDSVRDCWNGRASCVGGYCDLPTNLAVAPTFQCNIGVVPDPCLDDGDFHFLGSESPGVDDGVREHEGVDYCSATDLDGVSRPQPNGGACDMGAYEWVW